MGPCLSNSVYKKLDGVSLPIVHIDLPCRLVQGKVKSLEEECEL